MPVIDESSFEVASRTTASAIAKASSPKQIAAVMADAKCVAWFQNLLSCSLAHIALDRKIGVASLSVAQIFQQTSHIGERLVL